MNRKKKWNYTLEKTYCNTHRPICPSLVYFCLPAGYFRPQQLLSNQTANQASRGGSRQQQTACPLSFVPIPTVRSPPSPFCFLSVHHSESVTHLIIRRWRRQHRILSRFSIRIDSPFNTFIAQSRAEALRSPIVKQSVFTFHPVTEWTLHNK